MKDILLGVRPEKIKVNRKRNKTDINAEKKQLAKSNYLFT